MKTWLTLIVTGVVVLLMMILGLGACVKKSSAPASAENCLDGGHITGASPPDGTERGCEIVDKDGAHVRHGHWVEWYLNGQKQKEGDYYNGMRRGAWTWWYPSGQKMKEGFFNDGRAVGKWGYWDETGKKSDSDGADIAMLGQPNAPSLASPEATKEPTAPESHKKAPANSKLQLDTFSRSLENSFK